MSIVQRPDEAFTSNDATAERDKQGRFLKGIGGRSPGRPKGSRVKLAENVVSDVLDSWLRDGPAALARVAHTDPGKYLDFIAKVLPREVKLEVTTPTDDLTIDKLESLIAFAEQQLAGRMINVTPVAESAPSLPPPRPEERRAEAVRLGLEDETRQIEAKDLF